jgi:hypothetical protein
VRAAAVAARAAAACADGTDATFFGMIRTGLVDAPDVHAAALDSLAAVRSAPPDLHAAARRDLADAHSAVRVAAAGPAGAPAAEDLVWAALRHWDPGLQRRLLGALVPMGPSAAHVGPPLRAFGSAREDPFFLGFGDDPERLRDTVVRVLAALGLPPPER